MSAETAEKNELPMSVVLGAIIAALAVVAIVVFMAQKSDPAMRGPHPPPRFDAAAKEAESHSGPGGSRGDRGPNDPIPGPASASR